MGFYGDFNKQLFLGIPSNLIAWVYKVHLIEGLLFHLVPSFAELVESSYILTAFKSEEWMQR